MKPAYLQDKVSALESRPTVFVEPDDTLRTVAHTLWVENVGASVVGDEHHLRGIISERDLVSQLAQGADPDVMTAEVAMTPHVIPVRGGDTVDDALYQMLDGAIRHLPVVEAGGEVVGMVSVRDLLRPLLADAPTRSG